MAAIVFHSPPRMDYPVTRYRLVAGFFLSVPGLLATIFLCLSPVTYFFTGLLYAPYILGLRLNLVKIC